MADGDEKPLKPPEEIEQRTIRVQMEQVNTVEVPCDLKDPDFGRWFDTSTGMHLVRQQNRVIPFVDGKETFAAMAKVIETATAADHYICLSNWRGDVNVALDAARKPVGGAASTKVIDYLKNAVSKGVQVRAMFWDQAGQVNNSDVNIVNTLAHASVAGANGGAILDNNTLNFGSHHQKILIVRGDGGQVIGFCGGVDFNEDRISAVTAQPGSPMHDVHCQIEGPAAFDLLGIFLQRWADHPDAAAIDKAKGGLRGLTETAPGPKGEHFVQIGKTYGNGTRHAGVNSRFGKPFYSFAPPGEITARQMIFHAIKAAKRFIYLQDQYLIDMDTSNMLLAQLPSIERLVILIPHPSISDLPKVWKFCKRFVDNLGTDPKISICYLKAPGAAPTPKQLSATLPGTYVHSKMWIFDDKYTIIGSANCNRRSYTHDSEVVAGIYDESHDDVCTVHLAHHLRMQLWSMHLNMTMSQVFDPIGSSVHWAKPPLSASIATFNQSADTDSAFSPKNRVSDAIVDPDGR